MSYVHVVITRASNEWKAIVTCMFLGHEALMKYELGGFRQIDKILDCDAKKTPKKLFIWANAHLL